MSNSRIENAICEVLTGDVQKNALNFVAYLRVNEMVIEREIGGYWDDKFYYAISYNDEFVCFILIGATEEDSSEPWVVWSDSSRSKWYENASLDEQQKEIAWKYVDICGGGDDCGSCGNPGGIDKTIFGKEFNNVCLTVFRFDNPNAVAVECLKNLVEIRKNDISKNN